ncbi:response regulator [Butyrivibrio proteoclasticus]|uniref:response regulator n=1 Tax=Butyrivibrio proteoclasticus TaxID=43305 RepID=UPI000685C873|nr:response regulator [Butyrivibrio proteoclasticus]
MGRRGILNTTSKLKASKRTIAHAIMILFTAYFSIMYNKHIFYFESANDVVAGIAYSLKYVPIMVVTALGGAVPGMISVLIIFLYRSIIYSSFSYMTFIYLVVACFIDVVAKRKGFSTVSKTVTIMIIMQLLVGDLWGVLLWLFAGNPASGLTLSRIFMFLIYETPGCALGCFTVFFILKKLPPKYKLYFENGIYYVDPSYLSDMDRYKVEGKAKLGRVVMQVIVLEAIILGFSAEIASNTLIPNMKYSKSEEREVYNEERWKDVYNAERLEGRIGAQLEAELYTDGISGPMFGFLSNLQFSVKLAMLISIIVIPMAILVNRYAQRRIANPIMELSMAVSAIYNSKDPDISKSVDQVHNLEIETNDEIEDLYKAVDLTFYRLIEYIELVKSRQTIEDQLQVEKSANEAKSRFLSNISHEIRTPINAVLGFDEMILRETKDETVLQYARDIQNSGKTLLALINDVLDFSKIEADKLELVPVEYDLSSVINDLVNMATVKADEKKLEFSINVNENIPHVLFGDEVRIKQCIMNILTNAIKYTEKGKVTLDVDYEEVESDSNEFEETSDIYLKIKVIDTGIGIREEDMDKLSAAFERIDEKRNRTIEGTGLGINIVNRLLDMMDSKLDVKSEYGKGSEFSFNVIQRVVDYEPIGDFTKTYKESLKNANDYRESFHAPDCKILVVDDTKTNLTVIEGLLKQTKIGIDTATSGIEAIEKVKKKKYDIIFLDHRMPEMDGIQTFHAMEELSDNLNKETPIIALTANAISGSREMYVREGFANYMSKPVDPKKLEEMILMYLPEDKVIMPGDERFVSDAAEEDERQKEAMADLLKVTGVDIEEAISRCGSADVARDVMKDFRMAIDERSGLIEKYERERDLHNYTIYVHGLKSSAKAIGAIELSEQAEFLERCGNERNQEKIKELTPELLELYRSYLVKLSSLFEEEEEAKPEIPVEELESAFASIKEFVSASYFDSADDILKMLDDYQIPEGSKEKYNEVKRLMAAVDRDGLLNIL